LRIAAELAVQLPVALAVIYGLAFVVWYELLRRTFMTRLAKRRSRRVETDGFAQWRRREAELAKARREGKEREAAEESEPDLERRYYYIARRTARAERDAAVAAAREAVEQAIERIERRHREIEAAIDHEESERIRWQLEHPTRGE
jgi:biopolymer transport protein ExbB/TolQ